MKHAPRQIAVFFKNIGPILLLLLFFMGRTVLADPYTTPKKEKDHRKTIILSNQGILEMLLTYAGDSIPVDSAGSVDDWSTRFGRLADSYLLAAISEPDFGTSSRRDFKRSTFVNAYAHGLFDDSYWMSYLVNKYGRRRLFRKTNSPDLIIDFMVKPVDEAYSAFSVRTVLSGTVGTQLASLATEIDAVHFAGKTFPTISGVKPTIAIALDSLLSKAKIALGDSQKPPFVIAKGEDIYLSGESITLY